MSGIFMQGILRMGGRGLTTLFAKYQTWKKKYLYLCFVNLYSKMSVCGRENFPIYWKECLIVKGSKIRFVLRKKRDFRVIVNLHNVDLVFLD